MKNFFLLIFMVGGLIFSYETSAQLQTPAPSPQSEVNQKVGLSDVTINYSRPSAKDREVFGELVPYGNVWRTGANAATTVEFTDDVTIKGNVLKAGKYSLYSIPSEKEWKVIFHSNWKQYGATEAKDGENILTISVNTYKVEPAVETFTIGVQDLRNSSATIEIKWANTGVKIPFELDTDSKVMANIDKTMAGPSAWDYYGAASYYLAEGKDLKQALNWINKAIDPDKPLYYQVHTKARIQKELGLNNEAQETARQSMELAKEAGDGHYIRINENLLEELSGK